MPASKKTTVRKSRDFLSVAKVENSGYPMIHGILGFFYFVAFLRQWATIGNIRGIVEYKKVFYFI